MRKTRLHPDWDFASVASKVKLDSEKVLLHYLSVLLLFYGNWKGSELENIKMETDKFRSPRYRRSCYREFGIPKKSGGQRIICAPCPKLRSLQSGLADVLTGRYFISASAHGFAPGRSVVTNASPHVGHNYVFNTDIRDFFPSITGRRVLGALERRGIPRDTALFIRDICCFEAAPDGDLPDLVLPQGAPSSPVLSNLVCAPMDRRLEGLARRFALTYTRYADDITFSGSRNVFAPGSEFRAELDRILSDSGFVRNEAKTRLQKRGDRQEVTGLTVCEKVNVSRAYVKNLRAAIFQMEMYGFDKKEYRSVKGRLEYLGMVRGKDDPAYLKLRARLLSVRRNVQGFLNEHYE